MDTQSAAQRSVPGNDGRSKYLVQLPLCSVHSLQVDHSRFQQTVTSAIDAGGGLYSQKAVRATLRRICMAETTGVWLAWRETISTGTERRYRGLPTESCRRIRLPRGRGFAPTRRGVAQVGDTAGPRNVQRRIGDGSSPLVL